MKVGDKVVCVDDSIGYTGIKFLTKNSIYTIRGFVVSDVGDLGVYLDGIKHPDIFLSGKEIGFRVDRFRPIDYTYGEEVAERLEKTFQPETIEV